LPKRRVTYTFVTLSSFFLCVALLLTSVFLCVYDRNFYRNTYAKLGIAQSVGMSEEDLTRATDALLQYCQGERPDLTVSAAVRGQTRQVFNEREIEHMADVRTLALTAEKVQWVLYALFGALLLFGILWGKFRLQKLFLPLLYGFLIGLAFIAAIGLFAAIDFDTFWTMFHHVFFTNSLWLLDPATSILINMVPQEFFFALVMRILLYFGTAMLLTCGVCAVGQRKGKNDAVIGD